jgi:PAS domain S-box-containing protein
MFCPLVKSVHGGVVMAVEEEIADQFSNDQTLKTLKQSEQRYRAMFENMKSGVVVCKPEDSGRDFVIKDVNNSAERISLVRKDEAIGKSVLTMFSDIDTYGLLDCLKRVYNSENSESPPAFYHKDELRESWIQNFIYKLPNGEIVVIYDDIIDTRISAAELRASEERWQFALEGARDGVWDWNARTNEVFFSNQWKAMLGYGPSEIGSTLEEWSKRLHPDESKQCYDDLEKHFRRESPFYENEHRLLCKDGTYKWILDRGKVMEWDADGKPLRVIGTHTDISERKRMEEALKQSEQEKFRTVADFTYDWEYWINPAGLLVYVSPSCERITGYRNDEFINNPGLLTDIIHPEDKTLFDNHFKTRDSEPAHEIDFRIITLAGETRWIGHSCQVVHTKDGVCLGRRVSNRDITERKQMEEDLLQKTTDLIRSNKDLEQFAYVAAHDLREPLVAVASYLKVLERLSHNPIEDNGRKCIAKALHLVLRMDAMLQGLLSYSRLTLTPQSHEITDCKVSLAEALSNLGFELKKSGAVVTNDTLPMIRINSSQLVTIFQNLIGNAIKYRETASLRVHVGCVSQESEYQFSVSDNGIGIEPPYLNRIFNMFERVKDLSGPSGTGIGLSTCRKLVERYGGRMWVNSNVGKGSTFYFTLPK